MTADEKRIAEALKGAKWLLLLSERRYREADQWRELAVRVKNDPAAVHELMEMADCVEAQAADAEKRHNGLLELLNFVEDDMQREVLKRHLIDGETVEKVADEMAYSRTSIHRLQKKALKAIADRTKRSGSRYEVLTGQ